MAAVSLVLLGVMVVCVTCESSTETCQDSPPSSATTFVKRLAPGIWKTFDPFLFCANHYDDYPAGNEKMEAPRRGNGSDFDHSAPYRMYHGDRVPGFPRHPHRGFETVTLVLEGLIDHADSMGNGGRFGEGDLQWMTAGSGVEHSEMFPLVHTDRANPLRLFQIWLNLPKKGKLSQPSFTMHWGADIPKVKGEGYTVTVYADSQRLLGVEPLAPPPDSWASQADSWVGIWIVDLQGGTFTVPAAEDGVERTLYFYRGERVRVAGREVTEPTMMSLWKGEVEVSGTGRLLFLQGRSIGEPTVQHGPFVMNTHEEIQESFALYRQGRFGGKWNWGTDAPVWDRKKPRFALVNGKEIVGPPVPPRS